MHSTTQLPQAFLSRMESMLGAEYPDFLASYENPRRQGLRLTTLKISPEDFLQEPSAMAPAALLSVSPGDRVLDLCAAPGGKATELGARLRGKGLLTANDADSSRCKALLRNLELLGIYNSFVTNETPQRLAGTFPDFFDKILVDAPCSGEGMFRKEPAAVKTWSTDKSESCARLQREILAQAVHMLSPGGLLMYSTCTFAPIENEGAVSYVLDHFPEMDLKQLPETHGFSPGNPQWGNQDPRLSRCLRLWPHKVQGEGHFLALFYKKGAGAQKTGNSHAPRDFFWKIFSSH